MTLNSMVSRIVLSAGLVLSLSTLAHAQATRTWVSGVGNDANPCSRTAPCKTFAGAIIKTAANGYINALDPGGFGAVTITKSITIDGGPFMAGVLATLGSNGIIINAAGIKVTLRNLDIEGNASGNHGINVVTAAAVHVERCVIQDFLGNAINHNPGGGGALLFVNDTYTRNSGGIQVTNARATIESLRSDANTFGVRANATGLVTIRNSMIGGGNEGLTSTVASGVINVENCVLTNNVIGIDAQGGATIRVSNSGIFSNSNTGLFNDGVSTIQSLSGNSVQGNTNNGTFTGAAIPKQ